MKRINKKIYEIVDLINNAKITVYNTNCNTLSIRISETDDSEDCDEDGVALAMDLDKEHTNTLIGALSKLAGEID